MGTNSLRFSMAGMPVGDKPGPLAMPGHMGTYMTCLEIPIDKLREADCIRTFFIAINRNQPALA